MPDKNGVPLLNLYIKGHRIIEPANLAPGVSGYLWGQGRNVPVTVYEETHWGKFLLATENEEYNNPRLYEAVMNGDNDELKKLVMPKEFYYMGEPEEGDGEDWDSATDLMNQVYGTEDDTEIEGEDDFYIPFTGDNRKKFASIGEEKQSEIIANVICQIGTEKEKGNKTAFVTFDTELEADLGQTVWPKSCRFTKTTVQFLVDPDDDSVRFQESGTTALSLVKEPKKHYQFQYSSYERNSPFPELEPADDGFPVPCHKTFLS